MNLARANLDDPTQPAHETASQFAQRTAAARRMMMMDPPSNSARDERQGSASNISRSRGYAPSPAGHAERVTTQPNVSIIPPLVPMAESWTDRVAHQRLQDQDLRRKGHSHIEDQKVMFINRNPYDETKLPNRNLVQPQTDRRVINDPHPNANRKTIRDYPMP